MLERADVGSAMVLLYGEASQATCAVWKMMLFVVGPSQTDRSSLVTWAV